LCGQALLRLGGVVAAWLEAGLFVASGLGWPAELVVAVAVGMRIGMAVLAAVLLIWWVHRGIMSVPWPTDPKALGLVLAAFALLWMAGGAASLASSPAQWQLFQTVSSDQVGRLAQWRALGAMASGAISQLGFAAAIAVAWVGARDEALRE
jgi:hypothetical protein